MIFALAVIVGILVWLATGSLLLGLLIGVLVALAIYALSSPRLR